jgi:large subunit ribosomal protein L18
MRIVDRRRLRLRRRKRVRKQLAHTDRPLLTVYRSNKHIYAQIVDPLTGRTLAGVSTRSPAVRERLRSTKDKEAARTLGRALAALATERSIRQVAFNRNGFVYGGRLRALADAVREAGLQF